MVPLATVVVATVVVVDLLVRVSSNAAMIAIMIMIIPPTIQRPRCGWVLVCCLGSVVVAIGENLSKRIECGHITMK
jgi:hypothetical protein